MRVAWGYYVAPYIYGDDLGPGGRTAPRRAEMIGGSDGAYNACGAYLPPWRKQLDGLDDLPPGGVEDCPPGWPEGVPCVLPPGGGGGMPMPILTEQEAQRREQEAFERGRAEEARATIKTAAISAAVSAVVGIAIGKLIG